MERAKVLLALGLDPTIDIWLPDPVPHPEVRIKTWKEWDREKGCYLIYKEYHTPAGVLRQVVKETEDWLSSDHVLWIPTTLGIGQRGRYGIELFDDWNVSRRTEPWVKGEKDLEKLKYLIRIPEGWILDEWREDALRAKKFAEEHGLLTMVRRTIVGDAFQWMCDIPSFLIAMVENPAFVEEFLGIFHEWSLKMTELALDLGVDVIQRRGWYENPDFWGTKYFEKFLKPSIEEETELVHEGDALHCYLLVEGHMIYLDILDSMDVDILWGIDSVMGGVNFEVVKEKLGRKKTLLGGLNAEVTLTMGKEEKIRESVREAIKILGPGGGFVLSPMAAMWSDTPWESLEIAIDEWRKYGKYPISL